MHGVHFLTVFMGGALLLLITLGLIIKIGRASCRERV